MFRNKTLLWQMTAVVFLKMLGSGLMGYLLQNMFFNMSKSPKDYQGFLWYFSGKTSLCILGRTCQFLSSRVGWDRTITVTFSKLGRCASRWTYFKKKQPEEQQNPQLLKRIGHKQMLVLGHLFMSYLEWESIIIWTVTFLSSFYVNFIHPFCFLAVKAMRIRLFW